MDKEKGKKQSSGAEISALPEGCIANIVSFTTPKDACRACAVSPIFRAAAESNAVWERFLPSDYQAIIARSSSSSSSDSLNLCSKKQIYLSLSDNPILIDDNKKIFFLEKLSGKKCYLLAARDLFIVWGSTPKYWSWVSLPESRFPEVAELLDVCWFEIWDKMSTSMLSPKTNYAAYLVFKLRSRAYGFDDLPFKASFGTTGGGEVYAQSVCLDLGEPSLDDHILLPEQPHISCHKQRKDGWLEIELGEFFNEGGQDDELQIRLMEVEDGRWKSGLIVEGIEIRPTMG